MSTEVQVFGLLLDEATKSPVVLLRAVEGDETLPIQIGFAEASAIAAVLEKVDLPRPMTHDLALSALEAVGARLLRVDVVDLRDGTFYGQVSLQRGRTKASVDCRPSDAIALALRAGVPIFVADAVFDKVVPQDVTEASRQQWMAFLHSLEAAIDAPAAADAKDKDLLQ
jgi:bifunctional DNase/RNase